MARKNARKSKPGSKAARTTRLNNTKAPTAPPKAAGTKRSRGQLIILIGGLLVALFAATVCAIPAVLSPLSDVGRRGPMPELYLVPENPNLYATESGTYGTDLNVQLFANGTNLFNPEALLSVEGKFSVRYGKEKPKPGGQELLPFSWKVYLPERTEGYRIINEHTPHEDGSIDVNLGQWIPAKPHEVIEMPVFATFKIPDWSRLYLFVAIQIKISDPVFTQGYDKDHGWTQTWRVGWAPVRGAPKIPNWFSVGESEPPDFWYETPEKFVKDKTIRHTNIFACEGCGTLRGFDNRPELSRGVYAIGLDPNTEKSIEILVPWRPWSWATPVFTWFLVGLGGLALAGAVGIWKRSVTGRDTSGAAGPSSPD